MDRSTDLLSKSEEEEEEEEEEEKELFPLLLPLILILLLMLLLLLLLLLREYSSIALLEEEEEKEENEDVEAASSLASLAGKNETTIGFEVSNDLFEAAAAAASFFHMDKSAPSLGADDDNTSSFPFIAITPSIADSLLKNKHKLSVTSFDTPNDLYKHIDEILQRASRRDHHCFASSLGLNDASVQGPSHNTMNDNIEILDSPPVKGLENKSL